MAKLFNTISLEKRYKGSLNDIEIKQLPEAITMPANFTNTSFRSTISLSNRLNQPLLGTTTHLPEYILSDQNTDYIKIKDFGVYEQISKVNIKPITTQPNQGSITLNNSNTIINQGGITINTPTYDSLLLEGTTLSNGVYTSITNTTPSISVGGISVLQGPGTNPTFMSSNQPINIPSSIVLGQPTQVEPIKIPIKFTKQQSPVGAFENIPADVVISNSQPVSNQGSTTPVPFNFTPNINTPILDLVVYEADRALAYYTPTIKHGSTDARKYTSPNNSNNVVYPGVESIDGGGANSEIAQVLGSDDNNINDQKLDNILLPIKALTGTNTGTKSSLSDYTTLTYDQIIKRSVDVDNKYKVEDFREGVLEKSEKNFINNKTPSEFKKSTENAKTLSKPDNDFILFQVKSLVSSKVISFRAFITSFNDSFNVSWNDVSYVGKQDVLKTFKNSTRTGTIGFKIAAFNKEELLINYTKLSDFVKIAAVGRGGVGDTYITGPLCQLTVGNWFRDTPCIFSSIKFDTQPTEYSWEIEDKKEVPHIVDVTVDFTVLGDVKGKPLNASTNNYFDYIK